MRMFVFAVTALGLMLGAAGRAEASVEFNFSYQASFAGVTDFGSGTFSGTPEGNGTYLLTSAIGALSIFGALDLLPLSPPGPVYENGNGDELWSNDNLLNLNGSLGNGYGQILSTNGIILGIVNPATTGPYKGINYIGIWAGDFYGNNAGYTYWTGWAVNTYPMGYFGVVNNFAVVQDTASSIVVPEPTTFAIWGLLGAASLVALRCRAIFQVIDRSR